MSRVAVLKGGSSLEREVSLRSGTNVELGKEVLRNSGVKIIAADDLDDAAVKAVACLA